MISRVLSALSLTLAARARGRLHEGALLVVLPTAYNAIHYTFAGSSELRLASFLNALVVALLASIGVPAAERLVRFAAIKAGIVEA
jgi:hypothetical protein